MLFDDPITVLIYFYIELHMGDSLPQYYPFKEISDWKFVENRQKIVLETNWKHIQVTSSVISISQIGVFVESPDRFQALRIIVISV